METDRVKVGQKWRLINIVNRPDVVVQSFDKYRNIVYWHYENENRMNENELEYFLKQFKQVE